MPRPAFLPGDQTPRQRTRRAIRVDHAGEYGAVRIYEGQLAVLPKNHPIRPEIEHMAAQERPHLEAFDQLLNARGVRPTVLRPLWHAAGFALGAATALMGPRAAMACTAAVETEIDRHYESQIAALAHDEPELAQTIASFRADEQAHRDTALAHGAEETPGYAMLSRVIRAGCRAAIRLSERV